MDRSSEVRGSEMKKYYLCKLCLIVFGALLSKNLMASGKVFYCDSKAAVGVTKKGAEQYRTTRFKLKVTSEAITFGEDFGFLPKKTIPFDLGKEGSLGEYSAPNNWWIINYTAHITMRDGEFLFMQNYGFEGISVFAICENF